MFEEEDRETGYAVFLAVTLAIVVSFAAVAVAIGSVIGQPTRKPATRTVAAPSIVRVIAVVLFEVDKAEPPPDALTLLAPAIRAARTLPGAKLVISGYHDASGDAAANAELARRRAMAVGEALRKAGVGEKQIELVKPVSTIGGGDPNQARRVEVTIR